MKVIPLRTHKLEQSNDLMASLGVSKEGIKIMAPKSISAAFKIEGIKSWAANIIKQQMLSLGSDAAVERSALIKDIKTDVIVFGSRFQLKKLCEKLEGQPFGLSEVALELSSSLSNLEKDEFIFNARNKILKIKEPVVCGIINLSPDSFSSDGVFNEVAVLKKAAKMIKDGAKILDLGGESTRPYSKPVTPAQEIKRVLPHLKAIRKEFRKVLLSIDSYKYKVVSAAVDNGVDIVNDITSLRHSPKTASLIKKYRLGCVLMHMQGKPDSMQVKPKYKDLMGQLVDFFGERISFCQSEGIKLDQLVVDPGIGFGKVTEDNLKIINELYKLRVFGLPIFMGLSRKSFIGNVLKAEVKDRLIGTVAANVVALMGGANILRVHDVKEARQTVLITSKILNSQ